MPDPQVTEGGKLIGAVDPEVAVDSQAEVTSDVEFPLNSASDRSQEQSLPFFTADDRGMEGSWAGEWRLVEEIGQGGMGSVYRAIRGDGEFSQEAAVKILSRGVSSQVLLDRFRRERQILARFEHPNIARLLAGGKLNSGQPYLVMEYVQGMPLTRYCDERRLSVRDRIALFRKVCDAVSYAHRNLVVHRDLKPDNILVTGEGVPKLLDFGIAKLLEPGTGDSDELTMTAERIGTPAWSSPEQIRGDHAGIATDIYSLGVVLFRLLTGYRPYPADPVNWGNAIKVICEGTTLCASDAVVRKPLSPEEAQLVASFRGTSAEGLRKELAGDLDNILGYATRKEPDRRYRSVDEFSDELQRYLDGRPVMAAGDTIVYLAGKFIGRHKLGVAAATVLTLLLCISTFSALRQARRLSARVTEDRKLAASLLFELHDNIALLPGSLPARETLLRQSLDYLHGLARDAGQDRETRRSLARAGEQFGTLLGTLGHSAESLDTWQTARRIRESLAEEDPDDPGARYELATSYLMGSVIVSRAGSVQDMQALDRKALRIAQSLIALNPNKPEYQVLLADTWASLANGLNIAGNSTEATEALRHAVPIREKLAARPDNKQAQHNLSILRYHLGMIEAQSDRPSDALTDLQEAARLQTALLAAGWNEMQVRFDLASTNHFLGVALGAVGRYDEALGHFAVAINIREKALAEDEHDARTRSMLAGNYSERSLVLLRKSDKPSALASIQRAISLQQELLAVDATGVPVRINMATYQGRLAQICHANRLFGDELVAWKSAVSLYGELQRGGFLIAPDVVRDAAHAREKVAKAGD